MQFSHLEQEFLIHRIGAIYIAHAAKQLYHHSRRAAKDALRALKALFRALFTKSMYFVKCLIIGRAPATPYIHFLNFSSAISCASARTPI